MAECRGEVCRHFRQMLYLVPGVWLRLYVKPNLETVNETRTEFIFISGVFSVRADPLALRKHVVAPLWQFLDGHCLKCWVSVMADIFLVTLHLLYCLPTALAQMSKHWQIQQHMTSRPRMCLTVAMAHSAHSRHLINYIRNIDSPPTSGQLNDTLQHLTPDRDHLRHLTRLKSPVSHSINHS